MKRTIKLWLILFAAAALLLTLASCGLGRTSTATTAAATTEKPAATDAPATADAPAATDAPATDAISTAAPTTTAAESDVWGEGSHPAAYASTTAPATESPSTTAASTDATATDAPETATAAVSAAAPASTEPTGCAHIWNEGVAAVAPTCATDGETLYTCTLCGETKTVTVPATGEHEWTERVISEATCGTDGSKVLTCSVCKTRKTVAIPATEQHVWNAGETKTEPNCSNDGEALYTCTLCGKTKTEAIPANDEHVWTERILTAATCKSAGSKLLTCSVCKKRQTAEIPISTNHKLTFSYLAVEPTATKPAQLEGVCETCGLHVRVEDTATTYASYQSQLTSCKNTINGYTDSQFGGSSYSTMSTSKYDAPKAYPKSNEHPRVMFNSSTIADVRATFNDPANASKLQSVLSTANDYTSGVPVGNTQGYDGENYKEEILQTIRAKALLYQVTGVKLYGYDAIRMMKEFITNFKIADTSDPCRRYGEIMLAAAQVYDWCYDLLTSADKRQFIIGVQKKLGSGMEIGFPPSDQGAISGHGCERQLLRDYLSFAIAIYDEEPTWYKFIAGRFYQEYVPVRNAYYEAGYYPQGISTYLPIRFGSDLWSAWLIECATRSFPYASKANMKQVMHTAYEHIMKGVSDNGKTVIFSEGDHQGRSGKEAMKQLALPSMISAYLFDDPTAMSWSAFADYAYFPATYWMILKSKGTEADASKRYEGLDLIVYNGGWLGQMIAHSSWDGNSASVFMKIGNRTTANHDHADSGSFQIFYKALLAGDSGYYDKYESSHHFYYHQATIAHNSIVLKNGSTVLGQKEPNETSSFSTWKGDDYKMGTTTGFAYGYADTAKTQPTYAYIAGDIADAYCKTTLYTVWGASWRTTSSSSDMSRCDRRMLAVYDTGNSDVPLYFFVYDNVTAKSSDYQKVFLLHTITEPSISNKTATVVNGSGKLVLQNVVGASTVNKVGGDKPNNWEAGGKTYSLTKDDKTDGYWGRLEVATSSGSKNNIMLNVMYVCDADKSPSGQTAKAITNSDSATGAVIGKVAAVFVDSASRASGEIKFTASGSGASSLTYYVSGVKAGKWTVTVGSTTKTVTATEDGGLLVFTATPGAVTLKPAN